MTRDNDTVALCDADVGESYEIVRIAAGRRLAERLNAMGLHNGVRFRIAENWSVGPMGIDTGHSKLGIGRGMASRIWVRHINAYG